MACIAWSPRLACYHISPLHVGSQIAWRESVLHSQRVEERLNCRTHLTTATRNHIIHEVCIVQASHVRLYGTRSRVHTHKSCSEERLNIANAVYWCHRCIDIAMICEYRHIRWSMERLMYFFITCAICLQYAIAFALQHSTFHNLIHLLLCELRSERSVRFAPILLEEFGLQIACHMSIHSLFSITLHARVDCGVHLKSVGIKIVWSSVLLEVLVTPAIKWVCIPCY